jgi:hypothetical protein
MAEHKWDELAQQVGQEYAATIGNQPVVEGVWVSTDEEGVELWVVTAPAAPADTRCLWAGYGAFQRCFEEADVRLHVLNRRNYPGMDLDDLLPEDARLIKRFANAG